MAFRENINRICKEKNTTLTQVIKEIGFSVSKTTAINRGQLPNEETLMAMAKALDCSVMDFFIDEGEQAPVTPNSADELDILTVFRALSRRQQHEFMSYVYSLEDGSKLEIEVSKP